MIPMTPSCPTGSAVQHGQHCHPPLRQPRSEPPHSAPQTNPLRLLAPPRLFTLKS
ncbi:hypothetical protein B9Z19DRAFT_1091150 [Tuber borchii]|uniref:Uncharacterized protein n=1 Tax=Tuber borchii TaxID=42251 RepID=A0A2T6ZI11_TUBBO|nr:hypothetical protein B9Z19DRAFT_1091150 [Tuber borchii]